MDGRYRLFISFSGGRTSAYMTKRLLDIARGKLDPPDVVVLFANTGREHEETLRFVERCDRAFGFGVVWVEAVVSPEHGVGTSFRVVDFATASREGEPMEAVIQKYGIPNRNFPHCTREAKLKPMQAYLRSIGWEAGTYDTAIGIRADELERYSEGAKANRIIYPLINWRVRKEDILTFWAGQSFDLNLAEHLGNCVDCWKKSLRKRLTIAADHPEVFAFTQRMEEQYPHAGAGEGPRRFFREGAVADLLALSRKPFVRYEPDQEFQMTLDMSDPGGGCGESCEVFADGLTLEAAE